MKIGMIVLAGGHRQAHRAPVPQAVPAARRQAAASSTCSRRPASSPTSTRSSSPARRRTSRTTRRLIANHGFDAPVQLHRRRRRRARSRSTSGSARSTDCDSVIVHEAVRPLVTVDEFRALIAAEDANAMFGIPIPFTVLKGHDYVEDLLERDELVNVQLPQKFDRAKLIAAHEAARRDGAYVHRGRQPVPPLRRRAGPDPARARTATSRSPSRPTSSPPRRSTPTSSVAGADDGQGRASSPAPARASAAPRRSG